MANPPGPKRRRGFEDEPQSALRDLLSEDEVEEPGDVEVHPSQKRKSFADLLHITAPAPLSPLEKFGLGALAILVVLLFLVSLWKMTS